MIEPPPKAGGDRDLREDARGRIQLGDVWIGMVTLVALVALAPIFQKFIGMVTGVADPFTATALQLFIPVTVLALIISLGVSAKRRV